MDTVPNPRDAYFALTCAVCARPKAAGHAFCATDFYALTLWQRRGLQGGPDSPAFAEAFLAAFEHLRALPTRARLLTAHGAEWPYRSLDELRDAGYRQAEQELHCYCRVPGCRARLIWLWTPANAKLAVDYTTLRPHRPDCADPAYFARRKAEKAAEAQRRAAEKSAKRPNRKPPAVSAGEQPRRHAL